MEIHTRESIPSDCGAIMDLYRDTFPDEDLVPLVKDLLEQEQGVLSLIAVQGETVIGHVGFTFCTAGNGLDKLALLAPLAVAPNQQRNGVGRSLVRAGFDILRARDTRTALVLGDPAYYGRFGFKPEWYVHPPYALPKEWREAWQSVRLFEAGAIPKGTLSVPKFWMKEVLWR